MLCLLITPQAQAQGDCAQAIQLTNLDNWCSPDAAYITYPAASGYAKPTCWGAINRETWFKFTAVATYVHISVYGATYGGNLQRPEIALYSGTCGGTLNERKCSWAPNGVHYAEVFNGGLTVGETYLIRVDGINNPEKNFKLCINNFNTTTQPGQDCNTALYLCTQQDISLEFQPGGGASSDEATNTCMDGWNDPFLEPSETNSVWMKWECGVSGTLTFDIVPTQIVNDLDWCLFELPNGINNCAGKIDLRCNSSSCQGATGLNMTSTDLFEDPDCDFGEDLYCRYVDMVAGKSYALVINNFTSGQDGFTLSFGGTGGFKDLQADFSMVQNCTSNDIVFTDNSTNAVQWDWVFGAGAVPATANTPGPHTVTYPNGNHTAVLTITDADGCTDFEYINFDVPPGAVNYTTNVTNATCATPGAIGVTVTSGIAPYQYSNNGGITFSAPQAAGTYNWPGLAPGSYNIVVQDAAGCASSSTVTVGSSGTTSITNVTSTPEDCNALNGSITVTISGSSPPYQYSSNGGSTYSAATALTTYTFTGLANGSYNIAVRDNNGCVVTQNGVNVAEQNTMNLISATSSPATCGASNGSISVVLSGGNGPYQFSSNNGGSFSAPQAGLTYNFTGLAAGSYTFVGRDANGCTVSQVVVVGASGGVSISGLSSTNANCTSADGTITVTVTGGSGPYEYSSNGGSSWSSPQAATNFLFPNLAGGSYTVVVRDNNGCTASQSISVGVNDLTTSQNFPESVCSGDSTLFNGAYYSAAGNYPVTLVNSYGCDSVVTLQLSVLPMVSGSASATLCPGESYIMPLGESITAAGTYTDTIAGFSCDSIVTVTITTISHTFGSDAASLCPGDAYTMPLGEVITAGGTYVDTVPGFRCDSIVTVTITAYSNTIGSDAASLCPGDSYIMPLGEVITSGGTYVDTIPGFRCDSIVTVTITAYSNIIGSDAASLCPGDSYIMPLGEVITAGGTYVDTVPGFRCDSIVTVTITAYSNTFGSDAASLCPGDAYTMPLGESITSAGTYVDTIPGFRCDSIVTVTISEYNYTFGSDAASLCPGDSYTMPLGESITTAGTYVDTIPGFRCDSIVTVTISEYNYAFGTDAASLCPGDAYAMPLGEVITAAGTYVDTIPGFRCDSIVTVTITSLSNAFGADAASICPGFVYTMPLGEQITTGGTFVDTIAGFQCDSIVTVTITALNYAFGNLTVDLCAGESYTMPLGEVVTGSGVYVDTIPRAQCDSIVTVTVNIGGFVSGSASAELCPGESYIMPLGESITAAGTYTDTIPGWNCDSIVTVSITTFGYTTGAASAALCPGETYTMPLGEVISATGTYIDTIPGFRCDSIVSVSVVMNSNAFSALSVDLCPGETYTMPLGEVVSASGMYTDTLPGAACDSIVTVTIQQQPYTISGESVELCPGESYTLPNGDEVSQTGIYIDTIPGPDCDVIYSVSVVVHPYGSGSETATLCEGETYTLPSGTVVSASGTYTDTIAGFECDSIVTVDVTVWPVPTTNLVVGICTGESYTINGTDFYTTSGTYTETLNGFHCDSIVTVDLVVSDFSLAVLTETICSGESSTINGIDFYTATGVYSDTLPGFNCDSIVVLNLTVLEPSQTLLAETICAGEQYFFNGTPYTTTGTYTDTLTGSLCDSIVTLDLTVHAVDLTGLEVINANCNGDGGQVILTVAGAVAPVQYAVTDSSGSTTNYDSPVIDLVPGNYTTVATDALQCSADTSFTIGQDVLSGIELLPEFASIFVGESVLLEAVPDIGTFQWSPAVFLDCDTCASTLATPEYSVVYVLHNDRNGCASSDTVYIEVRQPDTFIPTAFTPNGDTHNDILYVIEEHVQELLFFRIYNRWGEELFATGDIHTGWDGRFRGSEQEIDTYVYHLGIVLHSGRSIEVSGQVVLLR